jgi:hypothetical protein
MNRQSQEKPLQSHGNLCGDLRALPSAPNMCEAGKVTSCSETLHTVFAAT